MAQNRISDPSGERGLFANVDGLDTRIHTARGSAADRDTRTLNLAGDQWFNTDTGNLQVFDGNAWKNVYTPAPAVNSISPSTVTGGQGVQVTISGSNFSTGMTVQFVAATTGFSYYGTSVQVVNGTTATVKIPNLSQAGAPYAIKVTNTDTGTSTSTGLLSVNAGTAWTTAAGQIASSYSGFLINIPLQATSSLALTFSLTSGSLPSGVILTSGGIINGNLPTVSSITTYTFTLRITDSASNTADRTFTITNTPLPTISSSTPTSTSSTPVTITINGSNFINGSTVTFTNGGTTYPGANTSYISSSQITSQVPSGATASPLNVNVITPDSLVTVTSPNTVTILLTVSGGTLSSDATYYYRTFYATGSLVTTGTITADILVQGGGGGGGGNGAGNGYGGGAGAGGAIYSNAPVTITAGSYTVQVGGGGTQAVGNAGGTNGTDSFWNNTSFSAFGGGGGGVASAQAAPSGGCGGGSGITGGNSTQNSPSGFTGYGNVGSSGSSGNYTGGGGGIGNTYNGQSGETSCHGGDGKNTWASFPPIAALGTSGYIGGGGAGAYSTNNEIGGLGGGASSGGSAGGQSGTANTGGGGSGGTNTPPAGGTGGSGIVVVRYTRSQVGG